MGAAHGAKPWRQLRGRPAVADRHAGARPPLVPGQPAARRGAAGKGLHWVSRWHLLIGIGHYFTAPMWAMLMLVGLAIPLHHAGLSWGNIELSGFSPTTYWREQDPDRFVWVFVFTMGMLLAPKLMGFIATMFDRDLRRGCGG